MLKASRLAFVFVSVFVFSVYLPTLVDMAFDRKGEKTHLFFSPVIKKFVWTENVPEGDEAQEDKHHGFYVYTDEDGNIYDRQSFEKLLPFIYYRNMELWDLLPLEIDGKVISGEEIKNNRLVLELSPAELPGHRPDEGLFPLIESVPYEARLSLPENRFRIDDEMVFVDADTNKRDEKLTRLYTDALAQSGFVFPGNIAGGRSVILKPFDEGVFLSDAEGNLFHVKRIGGFPHVVKTPVESRTGVRFVKVLENSLKEFYGLMLENDGSLSLISYDNYDLIRLNPENYYADTMDFKLIIDPLYRTAVYSDSEIIRASVMDENYKTIRTFSHTMQGVKPTEAQRLFAYFVPFRISMNNTSSLFIPLDFVFYPLGAVLSGFFSAAAYLLIRRRKASVAGTCLILATGFYGFLPVILSDNL